MHLLFKTRGNQMQSIQLNKTEMELEPILFSTLVYSGLSLQEISS